MHDLVKKLQFLVGERALILGVPAELRALVAAFGEGAVERPRAKARYDFLLGFAKTKAELLQLADEAPRVIADGDSKLWIAYPKGTSRRYRADFNRDNGFAEFATLGFESVRMIALDADWSALRLRRGVYVKARRAP